MTGSNGNFSDPYDTLDRYPDLKPPLLPLACLCKSAEAAAETENP